MVSWSPGGASTATGSWSTLGRAHWLWLPSTMFSWLSLPFLVLSTAHADLLSLGIRGANEDSRALASGLDSELSEAMATRERLQAVRGEPEACGAQTLVACLLDQGLDGAADLAMGGELVAGERPRVLFSVVDVGSENLLFTVELVPLAGELQGLGDDMLRLLIGVATEDIDPLEQIRQNTEEDGTEEAWDRIEDALQHRLPERWELSLLRLMEPLELEKIAVADVDRSALPAWEQLGMEPDEYGLFQASGMSLDEWLDEYGDGSWRSQVQGRSGQIILRPVLGLGLFPHDTIYEGWYLLEASDLAWTASAAWLGRESSVGADLGLWVGFGLSPKLELDLGVGFSPATYTTTVQLEIPGDSEYEPQSDSSSAMDIALGARLLVVPRPMQELRPIFGGGLRYLLGPGTPSNNLPTESAFLPSFDGSRLGLVEGIIGIEKTTQSGLDLTVWVPIGLGLLGHGGETFQAGEADQLTADRERSNPWISVGIELGLGLRKGG
jgi:hypothetical protein